MVRRNVNRETKVSTFTHIILTRFKRRHLFRSVYQRIRGSDG